MRETTPWRLTTTVSTADQLAGDTTVIDITPGKGLELDTGLVPSQTVFSPAEGSVTRDLTGPI